MSAGGFTQDWPRYGLFALILALHGLLLAWLSGLATRPPDEEARPFSMRMLPAEPPPAASPLPPPRPAPTRPAAAPPSLQPPPRPAPVLAATAPAAVTAFTVPAQPAVAMPAPAAAPVAASAAAATPATVPARFDADYLHNPKPSYPALSRRMGEEGRVVLRVQVKADGTAETVDVAESSGFPRLDQAARDAVQRWRFVPARRGDQAVPSSIRVPLLFRLEEG